MEFPLGKGIIIERKLTAKRSAVPSSSDTLRQRVKTPTTRGYVGDTV